MRYLLPLLMLLVGCSQKVIQSTRTIEKDSTHIDTVRTRKVVKTKGDSVGMTFKIKDWGPLSSGQLIYPEKKVEVKDNTLDNTFADPIVFQKTQKQGRLTESVTISKKGNVVISCKEDSLKEIIEAQRITIQKFKNTTTTQTKTIICPSKSDWEKFCEWWTWFCIVLIIGGITYRFRKYIPYLKWIP